LSVEVLISAGFWSTSLGVEVEQSLESWRCRGWIQAQGDPPDVLQILDAAWRESSIAGKVLEDEAARDLVAHAETLCRLAEVPDCKLHVSSSSYLGASGSRFQVSITEAPRPSSGYVEVRGPPARHPDAAWFLKRSAGQPEHSSLDAQIRLLAEFRQAAEQVEKLGDGRLTVSFDEHLSTFDIRAPSRIGLHWREGSDSGSTWNLTAYIPSAAGGSEEEVSLGGLSPQDPLVKLGKKTYIPIDQDTALVLRRAKTRFALRREAEVLQAIADPTIVVPEGVSTEGLDFSEYGSRVLGFGPVARAARSIDIQSSGARWFNPAGAVGPFMELVLPPVGSDQPAVRLTFARPEDAFEFRNAVRAALGPPVRGVLTVQGIRVLPTPALFHRVDTELDQYLKNLTPPSDPPTPPTATRRIGVKVGDAPPPDPEAPAINSDVRAALGRVLNPAMALKRHQEAGLAWLWTHYTAQSPGVLLADEMGLGKTLQIACFLGLQRAVTEAGLRPALVVAPLLLLENWAEELARFLAPEAFEPLLLLHGAQLSEIRRADGSLDLAPIKTSNVVLTNYDTLDRYQASLLKVDWRAVVLDESQQIKNPDTLRSKAARALKRDFAICSTGTPVENRLLDLWTLFDFLSPLKPLGTRAEFKERFEPCGSPQPQAVAKELRIPSPASPVLRRTKDKELDLPPKRVEVRLAEMTADQHRIEQRIVRGDGRVSRPNTLEVLNQLRSLYQHPWLLRRSLFGVADDTVPPDLDAICESSPKMALTLDILADVASHGEKALIFTPWARAQQLLVRALQLKFGIRARVVNGESNQRSQSMTFIREFSAIAGFSVLVISPIAAGAGLNIVAANHVIHYGRWWNPAKEDQATDRAYRIGQTLPVSVHYPILHHPGDPTGGFDVALHGLVERKRELARDFLSPEGDVTNSDIEDVLFSGGTSAA
jgi:hypothetical protein